VSELLIRYADMAVRCGLVSVSLLRSGTAVSRRRLRSSRNEYCRLKDAFFRERIENICDAHFLFDNRYAVVTTSELSAGAMYRRLRFGNSWRIFRLTLVSDLSEYTGTQFRSVRRRRLNA